MIFNSILFAFVWLTCATMFILSTVHAINQAMDNGFNPIATVDLATHDFAVEVTDTNRSFRVQLAATNPITYHGGPVLTKPIPVYLLYYGTWSTSQIQIVNDFLGSLR